MPSMTPQQMLPLFAMVAVFSVILAAWVGLDAWERGTPKPVCWMWFLGVLFFNPVAVFYALIRIQQILAAAKERAAGAPPREPRTPETPEAQAGTQTCPYCEMTVPKQIRVCPGCGRIL